MSNKRKIINRDEVLKEMTKLIEESPSGEAEVPSSELAQFFNAKSGTIDYHLRRLVDEGELVLSNKRGRYNRKRYRLPSNEMKKSKNEEKTQLALEYNNADLDDFRKIIQEKMKEKGLEELTDTEMEEVVVFKDDENHTTDERQDHEESSISLETAHPIEKEAEVVSTQETVMEAVKEKEEIKEEASSFTNVAPAPAKEEPKEESNEALTEDLLQVENLSLDSRIELFLKQANNIPTPEQLLTFEDKEILSVINESIQQNIVYLNDLSEQLSTVQNKQLIQSLIDERNLYLEEKSKLQEENDILRAEVEEKTGKFDLDPLRIRHIQQNLINVLDTFLSQPNNALAFGRHEFRNQMTEQINDAFRYILNLEK